ncbi:MULTISPECIES: AMMECR1 domain-containing protein [Anaerococcus]|uniref:AMMECR1 domain-containing protein n=1 Tax=Anaerococcus TaxID=165779 RepID=UPI00242F0E9C|nr:AMMECR1 domain-containing protein [Anaerococcus vaginalis]MBS6921472.1 AMMECR1 domain-containing protein [Anaerococcus vaginalis]MDU1707654.1 AMMECR1 domain-containing protein [Anaerococcus vaginalis]MDU1762657.1 AMMECR1 domain-containing protein [Anaerococcus vaginalis]MDU2648492.1 AMMECR1 domain-containing protein [Anaerococcus vaginalis]MDU5824876.1 AMMECR1 domain-containing protein [Anaerococcus vaginalis]
MDDYVKLAYDAIEYYLENKTYLRDFDEKFKKNSNGIRIEVKINGRLKGISGSIFPTRKNLGLDIIYEAVNAGFFDLKFNPITKENLKDLEIKVFEYFDVEKLRFIEDFNDYDGIMLSFMEENYYLYRKDFKSDIEMLEKALKISNVDSWDNFSIDKFRLKIHK